MGLVALFLEKVFFNSTSNTISEVFKKIILTSLKSLCNCFTEIHGLLFTRVLIVAPIERDDGTVASWPDHIPCSRSISKNFSNI